ncbi:MAG TPA: hypothetical protein PK961_16035 [bacterium]|nr:hypothetical protein [bacterium]
MFRLIACMFLVFLSIAPVMANDVDFDAEVFTVSVSPVGVTQWTTSQKNENLLLSAAATGTAGDSYWLTFLEEDYTEAELWRLDAQGAMQWGIAAELWATLLAVDAQGQVLVAGSDFSSDYHFFLRQIAADGQQLWQTEYVLEEGRWTATYDLRVDSAGAAYATGTVQIGKNEKSIDKFIPLIKFDADGQFQWMKLHQPDGEFNNGFCLAIDGAGNAIVAGYARTTDYDHFLIVLKYSSAGELLWNEQLPLAQDYSGYAYGLAPQAVAVDENDDIYVAANDGSPENGQMARLIKYSSAGEWQWSAAIDEPGDDFAADVAVDGAGDVTIAGFCGPADDPQNIMLAKYDATGIQQWYKCLSGDYAGAYERFNGLALDGDDNIYAAGGIFTGNDNDDAPPALLLYKFASTGEILWNMSRDPGLNFSYSSPYSLAMTEAGNIVVNGYSCNFPDSMDDDDDAEEDDDTTDDDAADDDTTDDDTTDADDDDDDDGCGK